MSIFLEGGKKQLNVPGGWPKYRREPPRRHGCGCLYGWDGTADASLSEFQSCRLHNGRAFSLLPQNFRRKHHIAVSFCRLICPSYFRERSETTSVAHPRALDE